MLNLAPGEIIQIEMRKHWFVLFADLFGYIVLYLAPFALYTLVAGMEVPFRETALVLDIPQTLGTFLTATWSLIMLMRIVGVWTDYYLDVWTVTNKRVIDLEQKGLFNRKSSAFRIERIQDITIEVKGIVATFLDFGEIHVQTAGESQEFVMLGISRPRYVREVIVEQLDRSTEQNITTPSAHHE